MLVRDMRTALVAIAFGILPAAAQSTIAAKAGLISYTEGEVFLDGKAVQASATHTPPIAVGGVLRSGEGRAEVILNPCAVLHMDANSSLRLIAREFSDTRVELVAGSAVVQSGGGKRDRRITVLAGRSASALAAKGRYRFDSLPPRLKVFAGRALVDVSGRTTAVSAGQEVALESGARPDRFDPHQTDSLDLWSEDRMAALARESGLTGLRRQEEDAASARRTASMDAQTRDPKSIHYDPNGPGLPTPAPMPRGSAPPSACGPGL